MTLSIALLHGFTGSARSWSSVTRLLPATSTVIAPPLAGHGHPASTVSNFEQEVDRLASVLGGHGSPFCIAGYSLGARLSLGLLIRHPALFASAVLIGANPGLVSEVDRTLRRDSDERLCRILEERGIAAFVDQWEALPLFATQGSLPATLIAAQRTARLAHDPLELARSLRATGLAAMPSYWEALASVRTPVSVVAGELDTKFRDLAARMARLLPNGSLHVIPNVGHNVPLEAPEAVADILRCRVEASS